jgi:predicted lysophospholipase L1 biosynthesis ABC-type transport system permease subunit
LLNALGISLQVTVLLLIAGATPATFAHPSPVLSVARLTLTIVAWTTLGASYLVVIVNRFSQVRERAEQFTILKILGASPAFFFDLLLHETMLVTLPGTVAGILLAFAMQGLIAWTFPGMFLLRPACDWWLLSAVISAILFMLASVASAWNSDKPYPIAD